MRVGVEKHRDPGPHHLEAILKGARFATVRLPEKTDSRIGMRDRFHFGCGPVRRTVIHHDDFQLAFVIGGHEAAQRFRDHLFFVERGDDHADRRGEIARPRAAEARRQPDHDQGSQDDQRRRHNHERPEKFFRRMKDAEPRAGDEVCKRARFRFGRRHQ
jgi:hypothetical protein